MRIHGRPVSATVALTAALLGCESPDAAPPASVGGTIDTVGGVIHVRNRGIPSTWTLEPLVRIGKAALSAGEPDPAEFGQIAGVVADAAGDIYVADRFASEIRVFDEGGSHLRTLGREGEGPGEFRSLLSIGWLGDSLVALDGRNARLGFLSPAGDWHGHRPYQTFSGAGVRLYPTGPRELYMPFLRITERSTDFVFVRQLPSGPADTLIRPRDERGKRYRVLCEHDAGQGISDFGSTLAPRSLDLPAPGTRRAHVWTADYRIAFLDTGGDTVRVVERDLTSQPISGEEWRSELDSFEEFLDRFDDERCEPERLPRPEVRSLIRAVFFDDSERMWVERRSGSGFAFDIFDAEGRHAASVEAPERAAGLPPYVRGDRLYVVERDSLGVSYAVAYRIATR